MLVLLILGVIFSSVFSQTTIPVPEYDSFYPTTNWSDPIDWKLFKVVTNLNPGKNVLISPISLKLLLVLLYEGSSGTTQRELQSVLQFLPKNEIRETYKTLLQNLQPEDSNTILSLSTKIFVDDSIQPQSRFVKKSNEYYKTDFQCVNFSIPLNASAIINNWVENATNGKIGQITSPEDLSDAIMIVANALYFKGLWRNKFIKNETQLGKFYLSSTDTISVNYMSITDEFYFFESSSLEAKILRLPYKGGKYSMFIILPLAKYGLTDLMKLINLRDLHRQMYLLDKSVVSVVLPKFNFNFQTRYQKILMDLGLQQMFQSTASFPGIALGNNTLLRKLVVSDIIQKAGISVDEEGSEIYASTDITIGNKLGEVKYTFNATHPFLFFVEDETSGTILFSGKVENPIDLFGEQLPNKPTEDELFSRIADDITQT